MAQLNQLVDITARHFPQSNMRKEVWVAQGRPSGYDFYLTGIGSTADDATEDLVERCKLFLATGEKEKEE